MRFDGHLAHDLFIERNPARLSAHRRQQPVVKAFAPAKPSAMQVKGYSRH
jgi:hypothetical protein